MGVHRTRGWGCFSVPLPTKEAWAERHMTRVHFLRPRGMTFQTFALEQSRQPGKRAGRGVGSEEPMGEGGVVQLILLHVKHTRVHPGIPKAAKVDRAFSPLLQSARNVLSAGQENIRLARPRRALPLLKRLLWGWAGGSTPWGGGSGGGAVLLALETCLPGVQGDPPSQPAFSRSPQGFHPSTTHSQRWSLFTSEASREPERDRDRDGDDKTGALSQGPVLSRKGGGI